MQSAHCGRRTSDIASRLAIPYQFISVSSFLPPLPDHLTSPPLPPPRSLQSKTGGTDISHLVTTPPHGISPPNRRCNKYFKEEHPAATNSISARLTCPPHQPTNTP